MGILKQTVFQLNHLAALLTDASLGINELSETVATPTLRTLLTEMAEGHRLLADELRARVIQFGEMPFHNGVDRDISRNILTAVMEEVRVGNEYPAVEAAEQAEIRVLEEFELVMRLPLEAASALLIREQYDRLETSRNVLDGMRKAYAASA